MFGNTNNEQSQNEVPVKKNWFSNFLRSGKVEHNVTDLNDSVENNVAEVSSNLNSSMQEANSHTSNGTTDLENNQLQSDKFIRESTHTSNGTTDLENQLQSDKAIKEINGT